MYQFFQQKYLNTAWVEIFAPHLTLRTPKFLRRCTCGLVALCKQNHERNCSIDEFCSRVKQAYKKCLNRVGISWKLRCSMENISSVFLFVLKSFYSKIKQFIFSHHIRRMWKEKVLFYWLGNFFVSTPFLYVSPEKLSQLRAR